MIKYRGQLRGSHELFQIYTWVITLFFHCMIDVLILKLCFTTYVLTERSGLLSKPGSIFFHFDLNLLFLMEFLYFTGEKRPVPPIHN